MFEKTKINEKRPGLAHFLFFKKRSVQNEPFSVLFDIIETRRKIKTKRLELTDGKSLMFHLFLMGHLRQLFVYLYSFQTIFRIRTRIVEGEG